MQERYRVLQVRPSQQGSKICIQKVEIFKQCQYTNIGYEAANKPGFSCTARMTGYQQAGEIVNNYGKPKYEDINRYKIHVKHAACREQ